MGQAADSLGRVGSRLRTIPAEGVQYGTKQIRSAALQSMKRDTGGDRRLSGVRNGVPLTVKVTTRKYGNLTEGHVMAGPASQRAQWFWMEEGTGGGTRSRRHRGRLTTYNHPGTRAKRTWSRPVGDVSPSVEQHFEKLFKQAMNGR